MNAETPRRPLITFILLTYNQEQYVRESLAAALAQTYQPLEIIVSDDCSPDRTFEIVQEVCRGYAGPHSVVVNRNPENLGIGAHIHKLHKMARGKWMVHAAGDDLSVPERVERIWQAVQAAGAKPSLVVSNADRIDESGRVFGSLVAPARPGQFSRSGDPFVNPIPMLGCTVAIARHLVEEFPAILRGIMAEDVVYYRRAHLRDGVLYLPERLVQYRAHGGAVSQLIGKSRADYVRSQLRWSKDRLLRLDQLQLDLQHIGHPRTEALVRQIEQHRKSEQRVFRILGDSLPGAASAMLSDLLWGPRKLDRVKLRMKDFAIRWTPWVLGYK